MNFHPRPLVVLSLGVFGQHWKESRKGGERKGTWSLRRSHRLWELYVKSRQMETLKVLCPLGWQLVRKSPPDSSSQPFSYPWLLLLVPGECRLFDHCNKCHTLGSLSNRKVSLNSGGRCKSKIQAPWGPISSESSFSLPWKRPSSALLHACLCLHVHLFFFKVGGALKQSFSV